MYDFHDDARNHHGSQGKHWPAFKRQSPSLAWALLGTLGSHSLGHTWALFRPFRLLRTLGTFRHWETLSIWTLD